MTADIAARSGRLALELQAKAAELEANVDILIVDDDSKNLLALEAMLEPLGQNVVRAESGTQALRLLLERDFALVLLDVQMPGFDGFQTAELIRARERSRHLPIIFMTAFSKDDAQISQAYGLGAVDFLFKPVAPLIFRAKVQVFVELHRKTRQIELQSALLQEISQRAYERGLALRCAAERERAETALAVNNRRLSVLSDVASRLLVGDRPSDFLGSLHSLVASHLELEVYLCHLVQEDGETLALATFGGIDAGSSQDALAPAGDPVARSAAASRQRVVAEQVQSSVDPALDVVRALGLDAYACFPLVAQDRLLGTLSFGTRLRGNFAPDDLALMQVVCAQVAIALERARLIAELSLRNVALANDDRRKDEFLAMLAHELRNPMTPIVGAVQLLRLPGTSAAVTERALSALERQTGHLVRLIDDLLDLSRVTTGKIELRREFVTLASIVRHAIQTSAPLMEQHGHHFTSSLPEQDITLYADATRLGQVVTNLLNNAAKYSPRHSKIELSAEQHAGEVVIRVRDDGIGIQPEMLEEIFGLFVQSERTAVRSQGGLGIGLTLVKSLVELHGGSVSAHSAGLEQGSEFSVRLPIAADLAALAAPSERSPPVRATRSAYHVLVVEDNDDIRETMKDMLEYWNFQASLAGDGPSGVEAVLEQRPDVALIDIGLPGLDGYQVAMALRARAPELTTRLIALTGYGRPEDRARALAAGFDDHLVKPVTSQELLKLIELGSNSAGARP